MAGLWIKWVKGLSSKREVLIMSSAMGVDRHEVAGRLMTLWEWCDDNLGEHDIDESGNATVTLGALPERTIDAVAGVTGFASAMSEAGWLRTIDGQVVFPNFGRHNGETAKTRALTASRVAKHKDEKKRQGNGKGNGASVTSALPKEEKRREEVLEEIKTDAAEQPKDDQNKAKAIELAKSFRMPPGCDTPEHRGAMWRWLLSRYHKHGTWYHETAWEPFMMTRRHWTPEQWMLALTEAAAQSNEHPASYAVEKASKQGGPSVSPKSKTKELTAP